MPTKSGTKSELRIGFFELLFGVDKGYVCIALTDHRAPKSSFSQRFFEWPRESIKLENYILKHETGHNIYFCVNLLRQQERKKKHCMPTDIVWADLDESDPDGENVKIPPPIVIQSSPGRWQAFWRLSAKVDPYDAERYSRRIAYDMDADKSGWDLGQLCRVPYTKNFKYKEAPLIIPKRLLETKADIALFEGTLKAIPEEEKLDLPENIGSTKPDDIVANFQHRLDMNRFMVLYSHEPNEDTDWSKALWALELMCFRAGMSPEEVFVIANNASCNKYQRDQRPVEHLWREVVRASEQFGGMPQEKELLTMPQLVNEPANDDTFIDDYMDWASQATDAISEFHELSAFVTLSAVVSSSIRLEASWGKVAPNLWGLILGDSTVTRKTTSMKMAMDLLSTIEPELILATDGSVEGLLSGLERRPNKVSVFFRDEVSGLFDSINKKDYLSGMPETLAHLYDVPPVYSRLLRKEIIRIESPAFIFFGGGITERVYQNINESWIESGFMPRFLIVSGEFDESSMRPTGPPTSTGLAKRAKLTEKMADLYEHYASEVPMKIGKEKGMFVPRIMADMTPEAWERYQTLERKLTMEGYNSMVRNVALPTFERLARSIMKMSMILAATRQEPDKDNHILVNESDVINAAWYGQKWGRHSVELVLNAGKAVREKYIDKVYQKIVNNPGVLRSTILQHMHLTKREADEILGTLEERDQIKHEQQGKGRRYWIT